MAYIKNTFVKSPEKKIPTKTYKFDIKFVKETEQKFELLCSNTIKDVDFTRVGLKRKIEKRNDGPQKNVKPKFGAGSEYREEYREAMRLRKLGVEPKLPGPTVHSWFLNMGEKRNKKFKGIREGGFNDNASYCIAMKTDHNTVEVIPLSAWYNFQQTERYQTLSAEEAENQYARRKKIFNYFSIMIRKRMSGEEEEKKDEEEKALALNQIADVQELEEVELMSSDDDSDQDDDIENNNGEDEEEKLLAPVEKNGKEGGLFKTQASIDEKNCKRIELKNDKFVKMPMSKDQNNKKYIIVQSNGVNTEMPKEEYIKAKLFENSEDPESIVERSIIRYLTRKPITSNNLLAKLKRKSPAIPTNNLLHMVVQILQKLDPQQHSINGKMYLSLNIF